MTGLTRPNRIVVAVMTATFLTSAGGASAQATYTPPESGAPVITGFSGISGTAAPGQRTVAPTFAPIVLVPAGDRILFEGEAEFEGAYQRDAGSGWTNEWEKGVEYAQVDWLLNRRLTVVGGRFLTPFGIFNERLHSGWIRNLPDAPIVTAMELTSSNGAMVRGGTSIGRNVVASYNAFVSAASDRTWLESSKATGGRAGLFFEGPRVEVAASYQRSFERDGTRDNQYGADVTWQANGTPLDVRAEVVRNAERGDGYWIEAAYRLRRVQFARALMRKSQAVFRAEQFFAPSNLEMSASPAVGAGDLGTEEPAHGGVLPDANTRRFTAGWNYWITPSIRTSASYGRSVNTESNQNVWSFGLTYRFAASLDRRSR